MKWVGGKGRLLEQFRSFLPSEYGCYFEPFLGGAALFFALAPAKASLSDVNEELIDCYTAVRDNVDSVIRALKLHYYDEDYFYKVREQSPKELPLPSRAARTIFLNRTGYNGLYRVNSAGRFNVPFGRYTNPLICDEANLHACSRALQEVRLTACDFGTSTSQAKSGDFVYFDPPYAPISPTADFTSYSADGFDWASQERLAAVFTELASRGVQVMLSNSDVPKIRKLYRGFSIDEVKAERRVNSNAAKRGRITEIVVRSY
ncbi:MAG TPA: DNA adenine methylase [Polyangiaceae bacterium]|nr:DNA adenine methylase [Polyangiaceae bacterium]